MLLATFMLSINLTGRGILIDDATGLLGVLEVKSLCLVTSQCTARGHPIGCFFKYGGVGWNGAGFSVLSYDILLQEVPEF